MNTTANPPVAAPTDTISNKRIEMLHTLLERAGANCEIVLPNGSLVACGDEESAFRLRFNVEDALRGNFSDLALAEAYIHGEFDIEGDMYSALELRSQLKEAVDWRLLLKNWSTFLVRPLTYGNKKAIDAHYSFGDDFFLSFMDRRYRMYSHGLFHDADEALEEASEHKLESMFNHLRLEPGMRLLDIGGGWGGVAQYAGRRGVHVTELTLAEDSHAFISNLIEQENLPAEVLLEDFLIHEPSEPYDAICILGVIEHIPYYRRFAERVWACLKSDGRLYLDASATKKKHNASAYVRRYIWAGTHSFLCLQALLRELLRYGTQVLEIKNETFDYELTMRHWAERFESHRAEIVDRWGEEIYRAYRLYLWSGSHSFHHDILQAYHVVAQRLPNPGRRPGWFPRFADLVRELV